MKINKILVANRGEIALRVMRSAREMGIKTVAIYSEADRFSPHVKYADEAVCVGAPPSAQSYLQMDKIIEVAKNLGVDAIHPGYGFLSERAIFSQKVADAGLIFIGPSPYSIEVMGSKIEAKKAADRFGIPLVPGLKEAITDIDDAKQKAKEIGYPILIKASAGGGGKGMRIVNSESEFDEQMQRAISEATAAFGDGSVFIEKYITSPKHIEIQILGDQHGNVIYLFERECSIQRRHQKLVEEAPSSCLTPDIRKAMGECAVLVAKACNYYGAGTVEFVVDNALNFYFLEMNTRLQVEHPVTEMITGVDLVKQQIFIAEGKPLSIRQEDLKIHGHALEVRVCAEDPANNFLPEVGKLHTYRPPRGVGIRVDDGFEEGMEIPIYYDNMIAKLITYADNRTDAIERMKRAIDEFQITGIQTTLSFCHYVLGHEAFISGKFDTKFIEKYFKPEDIATQVQAGEEKIAAALISELLNSNGKNVAKNNGINTAQITHSNWKKRKYN
ncbi:MAG: acetyl-CoA carboxylase biotin carboxylase subunit [Thermoflexibacter sp.]|jgi:propionyl-CoA carboxylase alpha chain|nr:acetyl-CoA carboxylase biotin carboxylase subunit [Thermoflexibacter sp.]